MGKKIKNGILFSLCLFILFVFATPFVACRNEWKKKEIKECTSDTNKYDEYIRNDSLLIVKNDGGKISVKNIVTGKTTIKDIKIDWTASSGNDTLAVFCAEDRRGYFNVNTGKIVIEPIYRRAWNFSNGLAAVQKNGYIGFLDSKGNVVIDFKYPYYGNPLSNFVFENGYCVVADSAGKCGVINTNGIWVIDPIYDNVAIFKEYAIVKKAGLRAQIQYDGTIINSYVVDAIYKLTYEKLEYYENNEGDICTITKTIDTGMYYYRVGGRMGLMDGDCKRLTDPIYTNITAVNENIFRAQLLDSYSEVILNAKGEVMQ